MSDKAVILIAEDEDDYVFLLKKAFAAAEIRNPVFVISTGMELLTYFKGEGKYSNREEYPLPDLLLLDLKLPGFSGFEVLGWLRSHPGLSSLRVVVLTASDEVRNVNDAYRLGANSFLIKPYDFVDLVALAKMVQRFWLHSSKAPESFRLPKADGQPMDSGDRAG